LSDVGDSGWCTEEKSLNGNHVNCINDTVAVDIGARRSASSEKGYLKEMPLGRDNINGIDGRTRAP